MVFLLYDIGNRTAEHFYTDALSDAKKHRTKTKSYCGNLAWPVHFRWPGITEEITFVDN